MDIHSLHNILIILHAASATVSFFAGGILMFSRKYTSNQMVFLVYWWTLVGMTVLLAGSILIYWTEYTGAERIIFPGLLILAIYMLYRARQASQLLQTQQNDWQQGYMEHIGFTLISLFEGFLIVSGLNAGLPGWLVAFLAILGVLGGRWSIGFAQRRVEP
ncbi:MAG TPA: hypothetical protein VJ821_16135 [Anaerolineales bacterium]|nr:hypothetical protein [Anaerolineales bacterium]